MPDFNNKKIAIWGYGQEGQSALSYLHSVGLDADIIISDNENTIFNYDIVIKSPGISIYTDTYRQAKQAGVIFTTDTNIFLDTVKELSRKPFTLAVTGTKGKSTTSSLLAHILSGLGKKVKLGGNFGIPLTDFIPDLMNNKLDYVVAEISSYQAADLDTGFDLALLNNLYPEHLNWHKSHNNYYNDKLNLLRLSKYKIFNGSDKLTAKMVKDTLPDSFYFNDRYGFYVENKKVCSNGKELISLDETPLLGEHNLSNMAAVFTVLNVLGIDVVNNLSAIKKIILDFKPLPHRLERVNGKGNFIFIDDSISTTPETAMAALDVFKNKEVTLIAGGFERGQNYHQLAKRIKDRGVRLVAMGATGERLFKMVTDLKGMAVLVKNMKEAVDMAKGISPDEAVIILSPAAPSYDEYKNFQARGEDFKSCINC